MIVRLKSSFSLFSPKQKAVRDRPPSKKYNPAEQDCTFFYHNYVKRHNPTSFARTGRHRDLNHASVPFQKGSHNGAML